jgi:hypothetical protein
MFVWVNRKTQAVVALRSWSLRVSGKKLRGRCARLRKTTLKRSLNGPPSGVGMGVRVGHPPGCLERTMGQDDDGPARCGAIEQIRSARAPCPTTVLGSGKLVSSYLRRLSLRFLLVPVSPPQTGRMDLARREPASATWTECCAPVAPRALMRVSGGAAYRRKDGSHNIFGRFQTGEHGSEIRSHDAGSRGVPPGSSSTGLFFWSGYFRGIVDS